MRQAGLSQIPLSMGTPVQQAGLLAPNAAPAAAAPITMADRTDIVRGLAMQGMSFDEIQSQLVAMGLVAPTETPAEIVEPQPATLGDVARQGGRQTIGMALSGLGTVADRLGMDGAGQAARDIADERFGLTPEEQQARAARAEDQGLGGEIVDAAAGSLPFSAAIMSSSVIGGWLGGIAGSALGPAGTAAGSIAGRKIGATLGALLPAVPTMIGSAMERAIENGADPNDPATQDKAIATGLARGYLETLGIERLGNILLGPASSIAQRSVARAAARGGTQFATIEAAAEAVGELLEIAVFDPDVRQHLSEGELSSLLQMAKEKGYTRDIAIGSAAGALMGGGLGAPGAALQQNRINAQRAQDVETLAGIADEGGLGREAIEAMAQDPEKVPQVAQAARELGAARRDIQQAQTVLDAAMATGDADTIAQAEQRFTEATKKADETYDRVMVPLGAQSAAQIEQRKEQAAQRARDVLVDKGLATRDGADTLDRNTAGALAQQLAAAEQRAQQADEALVSGKMYDSEFRQQAQAEQAAAQSALQKARDDIAIKTGKATPEGLAAEAKQRAEKKQYDEAVERQYARKFEPLMASNPEAARVEAENVIAANKTDADKGLNAAIRKLETQLDKASTTSEIDRLEAEIADKRSRLGRQPPIVAAARRVLDSVGPRQGDAAVQGSSPAAARQTPEPEATTAPATPVATPTAPASAPEPARGQPEAAPAATPPAPAPAAVPAGSATAAPDPVLPSDLSKAAPRYGTDQVQFTNDIDRAAYITAQKTPSKRDADFMRFVQSATGMTPDEVRAHGARVRQAVGASPAQNGVRRVPAVPRSQPIAPGVEPGSTPTTRAQAQQQAEAEAAAAATQARLDREYQQSPAPTFPPEARRGPARYVDMLDAFGRRTATLSQARDWVRAEGAKTGYEYYVAFDRQTGEVLGAGTTNRPSEVEMSQAVSLAMRAGRDVAIVHNHPRGTTLSNADMALLYRYPGTSTITAVAPDGSTYTAEPTEAGRKAFGDRATKLITDLTTYTVAGNKTLADKLGQDTITAWVNEGIIDRRPDGSIAPQDVTAISNGVRRAINRAMAQEGLMRYTEAGPRELQTSREQAAYERGVKNARKAIRDRFSLSGAARTGGAGAGSGTVQRPGTVRSRGSRAARTQGGDQGGSGTGLAEPDGLSAIDGDTGRAGGRTGRYARAATEPLPGAPTIQGATGPDPALVAVADAYAAQNGIDLRRQAEFVEVDPERARRIADAYEAMPHAPQDPQVQAAYRDLIRQTVAQYRALEAAGYQFYFFDPAGVDPYAGQPGGFGNPWNAMRDLRANKRMAVFPTSDGFGISDADVSDNPLLATTDVQWAWGGPDGPLTPVTANDLFRAVHDAFGHGLEGAGFRARGEENAWQAHVRLFTGPAVAAITSETRGQNSWLNYGPHGSTNQTASVEDTVFADQKTGLMPEWTWQEGRAADMDVLSETAGMPEVNLRQVRSGQGAGRQHPKWHDFSTDIEPNLTPDEAAAEVGRRGADGFEYAIVTRTPDGAVLGTGTNQARNAVATSDEAIRYFRNDIAPVTFTHNHPDPTPLSFADLQTTFGSASPVTMVAVLPDGSRETATLTPAARALPFNELMDALHRAEERIYNRMRGDGLAAAVARAGALNRALAQAGFIDYVPGLPDPTGPKVKDAINDAIADLEDAYPAVRNARDTGRSQEPGGSAPDAAGSLGPEAVRSIRSRADRAATAAGPDSPVTGKASLSQQPDAFVDGLAEAAGIPGLSTDAQVAMQDMADTLKRNREAFKAARPDLSPLVMDKDGNPLVLFHGTQNPGFVEFDTEGGAQPAFTAFNPDTAVTYAGDFKRDLAEKFVRFRTENIDTADALVSPEVAEAYGVDISVGGSVVNPQYIYGRVPEGSPWRDILFPNDAAAGSVGLTSEQMTAMQQELGLSDADIADMRPEPWYNAQYRVGSPVMRGGGPVVDVPFPTARDLIRRMMVDRAARKIRSDALSGSQGAYLRGSVYPLFVDMTNPLVVDYQGREWDDAPHTFAGADLEIPAGVDAQGAPLYTFSSMRFDFDMFGGPDAALAAAQQWLDQQQQQNPGARRPNVGTGADLRTTDAWAKFAHREGYDGVIFRNIIDGGAPGRGVPTDDVFVVFRPEQLKHALDNTGAYSRAEVDILEENQQNLQIAEAVRNFKQSQQNAKKILQPPAWMDVKTQQGSALKAAIDVAREPGIVRRTMRELERQFINQLAPIRNYVLDNFGQLGVGMDDAYKAAEMAINDPGRNEALLYYGAAELGPNGEFRVAPGTIGIHTMLKKLPDGQAVLDWMEYMGARRAQEINAKGLETPLSDADIARGLAKETPLFKEVAADWKKFNDANVDFLAKTGRISKALAATLKADAAYIPFYRSEETIHGTPDLMDDAGIKQAAFSRRGGAVLARDPGIKKLEGGKERKVNNLIENMIRNSQAMVGAGMRNLAANKTFDMLHAAGDVKLESAKRKTEDGAYVNVAMPKHAVRMWKDGGEYYVVPQNSEAIPIMLALAGMQTERMGGIHKAMAAIGSFFRQSITLSPAFVVRNMIRDTISTGVLFQGKNLTMDANPFKGFVSSLRHSASRQAFTAQSGMGDFRFGGTDIGFGKDDLLIELGVVTPNALGALGYRFRKVVNAAEALGTASELSNRIAVYDALVNSGVRPDEAAYQALTITNYSRRGANAQLQALLPLVPFLNARIQGLSRTWEDIVARRGADRNAALMRLATSGAVLAAASALLWGWNNRDDESREEYMAEPLHRRLNYHIVYAGDRKIMIPKAFEVGTLFGTLPELAMQAAVAGDTSELGSATTMTLVNTFSFNPIPQAIMPAMEVLMNYNIFTGRPIEGQRVASLMREDRIDPQTSALAVALANSGLGSFAGLSPIQMDHLLAGYGGVAYTSLAATVDTVAGELGMLPARPSGVFGSMPVVNSALENTFRSMLKQRDADPANRFVEDFYQMREAITQIHRSARAAALTGDIERARQLLLSAPATPAAHRLVNQAGARLTDINSAIRQLRTDTALSADQKRKRMDALITERNKIATQVARMIREMEEQQGTSFRRAAR